MTPQVWQVVTNSSKELSNLRGVENTTDTANVMSSINGCFIHYLKLVDKKEHIQVAIKYVDFTCATLASIQSRV